METKTKLQKNNSLFCLQWHFTGSRFQADMHILNKAKLNWAYVKYVLYL